MMVVMGRRRIMVTAAVTIAFDVCSSDDDKSEECESCIIEGFGHHGVKS